MRNVLTTTDVNIYVGLATAAAYGCTTTMFLLCINAITETCACNFTSPANIAVSGVLGGLLSFGMFTYGRKIKEAVDETVASRQGLLASLGR